MIDWGLVGEIAGGGYGLGILVLAVLALVIWIIGLIVQKTAKTTTESKGGGTKEK
jgi:Na+-transporting methylmalonyl-CoA/oxaloacetate decarboxylase gamma subunit